MRRLMQYLTKWAYSPLEMVAFVFYVSWIESMGFLWATALLLCAFGVHHEIRKWAHEKP